MTCGLLTDCPLRCGLFRSVVPLDAEASTVAAVGWLQVSQKKYGPLRDRRRKRDGEEEKDEEEEGHLRKSDDAG